jgi:phage antirepressor YoqD-like protein
MPLKSLNIMANLILSKESSESEIKRYFNAVLELSKSDNEFPINLDEVWMLIYSEKGKAVRALKENFIEGVDYNTFAQNGKTETGGYKVIEYHLTVSCMEFFIARKVRPVFEVYRQVFHKVSKRELSRKELALMVLQAEEEKERLLLENNHLSETVNLQTEELQKAAPKVNYYDTHLQSVNTLTTTQVAKEIGMNAEKLNCKLKELGIQYRQSDQWLLKAPYDRWGMHDVRINIFTSERGNTHTNTYTVWTQRGRRFIIALYENDWNVKKAIKQIKGELNSAA